MWQGRAVRSNQLLPLLCAVVISSANSDPAAASAPAAFLPTNRRTENESSSSDFAYKLQYKQPPQPYKNGATSTVLNDSLSSSSSTPSSSKVPPDQEIHDGSFEPMKIPSRGELSSHAIFGTLHGETMIERYDIWKRKKGVADETNNVVIGHVQFGKNLDGHPTVVHGGILSLIFDDICGFAYEALGVSHAVTANLHIDYRAPVPAGTEVRVAVQLDTREGRKLFWKAQMTSMDQETLYAEASSLYIIPRSAS